MSEVTEPNMMQAEGSHARLELSYYLESGGSRNSLLAAMQDEARCRCIFPTPPNTVRFLNNPTNTLPIMMSVLGIILRL